MSLLTKDCLDGCFLDEDEATWFDAADDWHGSAAGGELPFNHEAFVEELRGLRRAIENASRRQRFFLLARAWKKETKFLSSIEAKSLHPAYQKIIGMGEAAVPFILADLAQNGPRDWFWALTAITEDNPITADQAGNMAAMTEAWLQSGRKKGLLIDCL